MTFDQNKLEHMSKYSNISNRSQSTSSPNTDDAIYLSAQQVTKLQQSLSLNSETETRLTVLKALTDPTKWRIYQLLSQVEELPVSDIAQVLSMSQSAVSHALSDLKQLEILTCHRCGQLVCYSLNRTKIKQLNLDISLQS